MFLESRMPGQSWQLHPKHLPKNTYQKEYSGHGLNEIVLGRDYCMFGVLAGVRGVGCLYSPRGFPDTASPELTKAWIEGGEHTPSYLSVDELIRCIKAYNKAIYSKKKFKLKKTVRNIFENPVEDHYNPKCILYTDVVAYCKKFIKTNSYKCIDGLIDISPEVRLVFWFDS